MARLRWPTGSWRLWRLGVIAELLLLVIAIGYAILKSADAVSVPPNTTVSQEGLKALESLATREPTVCELREVLGNYFDLYADCTARSAVECRSLPKSLFTLDCVCVPAVRQESVLATVQLTFFKDQDTLALGEHGVPCFLLALLDDSLIFSVHEDTVRFRLPNGASTGIPTFTLHGSRKIVDAKSPTSAEERETIEWIEHWKRMSDYRHLFWLTRDSIPRGSFYADRIIRPAARFNRELPIDSLTDKQLADVWDDRCLWLEKNMPYATVLVGATEYRVHTYSVADEEAHAVTHHVQISIQPRRRTMR